MLYISKGHLQAQTNDGQIIVAWRGKKYDLESNNALLWLRGRGDTALTGASQLTELANLGLVETTDTDSPLNIYRLLTNCVACPAPLLTLRWPLRWTERLLWRWIRHAGLRLSTAELIFLLEEDVRPVPELLGESNRQTLMEMIYTAKTATDRLLEARMEDAFGRDAVVEALLELLRKKYINLI